MIVFLRASSPSGMHPSIEAGWARGAVQQRALGGVEWCGEGVRCGWRDRRGRQVREAPLHLGAVSHLFE